MKADLVLLHAPSVYDFRDMAIMYGPVADLVPSTPIFEMYPNGNVSFKGMGKEKYNGEYRLKLKMLFWYYDPGFPTYKTKEDAEEAAQTHGYIVQND